MAAVHSTLFDKFMQLPPELRSMIWDFALRDYSKPTLFPYPQSGMINIDPKMDAGSRWETEIETFVKMPVLRAISLLHVNVEARSRAMQWYRANESAALGSTSDTDESSEHVHKLNLNRTFRPMKDVMYIRIDVEFRLDHRPLSFADPWLARSGASRVAVPGISSKLVDVLIITIVLCMYARYNHVTEVVVVAGPQPDWNACTWWCFKYLDDPANGMKGIAGHEGSHLDLRGVEATFNNISFHVGPTYLNWGSPASHPSLDPEFSFARHLKYAVVKSARSRGLTWLEEVPIRMVSAVRMDGR